jgi:hypothetical protein
MGVSKGCVRDFYWVSCHLQRFRIEYQSIPRQDVCLPNWSPACHVRAACFHALILGEGGSEIISDSIYAWIAAIIAAATRGSSDSI